MGQTITEKILSRVVGHTVRPGDIIYPEPEITESWNTTSG
jgi:hypothetical protein